MKSILFVILLIPCLCFGERIYYNKKMEPCRVKKAVYYRDVEKLNDEKWSVKTYRVSDSLLRSSGVYFSITPEKIDTLKKYDKFGHISKIQIHTSDSENRIKQQIYFYASGEIQAISRYDKNHVELTETFYPNGNLRHKYMLVNNMLRGEVVSYYLDGTLKRKEFYGNEEVADSSRCYDKNGQLENCSPFRQQACFDPTVSGKKCTAKFREWVGQNMRYPIDATKDRITGRPVVSFTVNKEGQVESVRILKSSGHSSLDEEAVRVVSSSPIWAPAIVDGEYVNTAFTFPITFQLTNPYTTRTVTKPYYR